VQILSLNTKNNIKLKQKEQVPLDNFEIFKEMSMDPNIFDSFDDSCLYCALKDIFTKFKQSQQKVFEPFDVRDSLNAVTGRNNVQGFDEGKMACALETLEEILNFLHRDFIMPNFFQNFKTWWQQLAQVC